VSFGGNCGGTFLSLGGGVNDAYFGTLNILHSTILENNASGGTAGLGGSGFHPGGNGLANPSLSGGLFISGQSIANATADTQFARNRADFGPDVFGVLGQS
jgi:hypothetical protein